MKNALKEPSMAEYAESRGKKKGEIKEVRVRKAKGGYIVHAEREGEYDSKPHVYKDLAGVQKCLEDKFGED